MTARTVALLGSLVSAAAVAACTSFYEIPIETPIQPKMDVSAFQRVLVAGFIAGGTDDVDANQETVRLLRSQLRSKSNLKVIEADALPLLSVVNEQRTAPVGAAATRLEPIVFPAGDGQEQPAAQPQQPQPQEKPAEEAEPKIRNEKDLEAYERIFADVSYWKKIGEEYQ
ncbi:MAG TPA: hypothetical protein VK886_22810 [Vicinamibacterales bacterium]|nr:hypothetical protein [Vicinamibacterales bacterium]